MPTPSRAMAMTKPNGSTEHFPATHPEPFSSKLSSKTLWNPQKTADFCEKIDASDITCSNNVAMSDSVFRSTAPGPRRNRHSRDPVEFEHAKRRSSRDGSLRPPVLDRVSEAFARHDRRAPLHRRDREGTGAFPPDPWAFRGTGPATADRAR